MSDDRSNPSDSNSRSLCILFEATWWEDGPPSLRRVLRESILEWQRSFPQDRISLLVKPGAKAAVERELGPSVSVKSTIWRPQALAAMFGTVVPSWRGTDVVFTHNFTSLSPRAQRVVLIHDFMFCEHPEWFTKREKAYFSWMPRTAPFAGVIFGTSETESDRMSHYLRGRRVVPVGLGMSSDLMEVAPAASLPASLSDLAPGEFILSVGRLNARKNLMMTIEAALDSGILSRDFPLLVVGSADGLQDAMPGAVREAVDAGLVRYTGFVDDAVLARLYETCRFFTFLSLDEGYGLPPLEALHFGAPVLVSDIPVFRELLATAPGVTFVSPHDRRAIASAMSEVAVSVRPPRASGSSETQRSWESVVAKIRSTIVETR